MPKVRLRLNHTYPSEERVKGWIKGVVLFILVLYFPSILPGAETGMAGGKDCLSCHQGIEPISKNHDFDCSVCHVKPEDRKKALLQKGHPKVIRNPSDPAAVEIFCLPCHRKEIDRVRNSLHGSMAGIINQTRYLWGAQDRAAPAVYGLSGPFKPLPMQDFSVRPDSPAMLVDDFLRRRCLRCHLYSEGTSGPGLYRASGCAACHVPYDDDGKYKGSDRAMDRSGEGYPVRHAFVRKVPDSQCLHCHNHNHVGADYHGLFEHDFSSTYRSPMVNGKPAPAIYGLHNHHLARDTHSEKGMWCIDCHSSRDIMGDGNAYSYEMEAAKISCKDCHGGWKNKEPIQSIGAIRKRGKDLVFVSANGMDHDLPRFSPDAGSHGIKAHEKVRCSACHAQWSFQDYGMSVIREDILWTYKWDGLAAQGDPTLQKILEKNLADPETGYPASQDRITAEWRPGIWSIGWRFRRWEWMPLGVDDKGKYAVLRPLYQFLVSYVDKSGTVVLDSVVPERGDHTGRGWAFMPYVPHTIGPVGRDCNACHQNRIAAGLGVHQELTVDNALTIPSPPCIRPMRLLDSQERKKLFEPTREWHRSKIKSMMEIKSLLPFSDP